jgi:maltooligosyltrehalose synthase
LAERADWTDLSVQWPDGRIKFALTRRLLEIRNSYADLFRDGRYDPVPVEGEDAEHVVAFTRSLGKRRLLVAAGRRFAARTAGGNQWPAGWRGAIATQFPSARDLIGDRPLENGMELGQLFRVLPVAVVAAEE